MKKPAQFDLDTEFNFSNLPPDLRREEIETICMYEYCRESRALRELIEQDEPSITPYLSDLYCSCKTDCPREYHLRKKGAGTATEYRIYCPHCDNAVSLPLIAGNHWELATLSFLLEVSGTHVHTPHLCFTEWVLTYPVNHA